MDPKSRAFRYLLLAVTCFLTFGSYYSFDMPSTLETDLRAYFGTPCNYTGLKNSSCVSCAPYVDYCIPMSSENYNVLYLVYAWLNAAMVIPGGMLVDKVGTKICAIIFTTIILVGQSLLSLGVAVRIYGVVIAGRVLFGMGGGSITVVQNAIVSKWFRGNELAVAFGITLTSSRLGSMLNFFFTTTFMHLVEPNGLLKTVIFGAGLCLFSLFCSFLFGILERTADRKGFDPNEAGSVGAKKKRFSPAMIKTFPKSYWILAVVLVTFYNVVFPFIADAPEFIKEKYYDCGSDRTPCNSSVQFDASVISGTPYYFSAVFSPFMGAIVDKFGKRGWMTVVGSCLSLVVFLLAGFTLVSPVVPMIILGLSYTVSAAAIWPSIPLLVQPKAVGTAIGIATSLQMVGIGLCNILVGQIQDQFATPENPYFNSMILFMVNGVISIVLAIALVGVDYKSGKILHRNKKDALAAKEKEEVVAAAPSINESDPLLASKE
uniref:Lysosomal dipeptide transporter MFSD1 n=1 Tax=Palpitomonas bilix TaxID=652834 RepID=A0A7S3DLR1_9EUKA|mmetsp:Transcript_4319/g.8671  ORF Transcript_4319/g.8671 Transcript_4319/m.8671 type:complete len:489 (+) Transcript_4319:84-1550(+)